MPDASTKCGAPPKLRTERLILRMANFDDIPAIINYFRVNEFHLSRSRPAPAPDFLTRGFWQRQITQNDEDFRCDRALRLFAFSADGESLVATVNFTAILRGPAQFCYLGYGVSFEKEGTGLMFEAAKAGISFAFRDLNLHRIMANYMPGNKRSGRLLRRLGFVEEGFARDYLFLNGRWCDHVMTSLTNKAWEPARIK